MVGRKEDRSLKEILVREDFSFIGTFKGSIVTVVVIYLEV